MLGSHKSAAREIPTADTLQLPDRPSPIAYWLLAIGYWLLAIGYSGGAPDFFFFFTSSTKMS
jgi:hypothetical protein